MNVSNSRDHARRATRLLRVADGNEPVVARITIDLRIRIDALPQRSVLTLEVGLARLLRLVAEWRNP
jgi:hypothetical protein